MPNHNGGPLEWLVDTQQTVGMNVEHVGHLLYTVV